MNISIVQDKKYFCPDSPNLFCAFKVVLEDQSMNILMLHIKK